MPGFLVWIFDPWVCPLPHPDETAASNLTTRSISRDDTLTLSGVLAGFKGLPVPILVYDQSPYRAV